MTSKIKVDNIANQSDSNIVNKCGTTLTIGASGDTVTLAAGASQSGFGQTYSAVSWDTTPKTTTITGVAGVGYFVNTSGGAVTANLPAGTAGDVIAFADYTRTFQTNSLTITPNGSEKIGGVAANFIAQTEGQSITLVYVDATEGWINTAESTGQAGLNPTFITATGGTITTVDTNYKVHTFTGPGTFTVCSVGNPIGSNEVSYMIVAAGAGGGGDIPNGWGGGGGGAGGFREGKTPQCNYTASPIVCTSGSNNGIPVTAQGYPIVVGGGGGAAGPMAPAPGGGGIGGSGNTSSAFGLSSAGGGGGRGGSNGLTGVSGGSGGGGSGNNAGPGAGSGNTPPVSPSQGNPAGIYSGVPATANYYGGSGGGGATTAGLPIDMPAPANPNNGDGGTGGTTSINGTPTAFAGGGGAGVYNNGASVAWAAGDGGTGGGGQGGAMGGHPNGPRSSTAGTANTGGGGGGSGSSGPAGPSGTSSTPASAGGSGIVVIRYKFQ